MPIKLNCPTCGELTRAPDNLAGKKAKCPTCGSILTVPKAASGFEVIEDDVEVVEKKPAPASSSSDEPKRKPCRACGEMIIATAGKCRFCGEIFDPSLRPRRRVRQASSRDDDDTDLTPIEWLVTLLCFNIGCIVAIVYICQGKSKGTKMLIINICAQFAIGALFGIISAMAKR